MAGPRVLILCPMFSETNSSIMVSKENAQDGIQLLEFSNIANYTYLGIKRKCEKGMTVFTPITALIGAPFYFKTIQRDEGRRQENSTLSESASKCLTLHS